jgi:GT2 family glycosyltransferase
MKLSIVIICWNDLKVIKGCLESIFAEALETEFEVIVSDNGSTDGSLDFIRGSYPQVKIIENGANLGFARGNNSGIRHALGDLVLILNTDTIIHGKALDVLVKFADRHPEAGAFGCRVLNKDGTYQSPARPFPTVWRYWMKALGLRIVGRFNPGSAFEYGKWEGTTEREIDWQSGCCVMVRGDLLKKLEGFDERFFYHFEEVDLCRRVWDAGRSIVHCPDATITHLGGQSVGRFPIRFEIEKYRNRYRYIAKHYGMNKARQCRTASIADLRIRQVGYGLLALLKPSEALKNRLAMYRVVVEWNRRLNVPRFVERGEEPDVGYAPFAPAPVAAVPQGAPAVAPA